MFRIQKHKKTLLAVAIGLVVIPTLTIAPTPIAGRVIAEAPVVETTVSEEVIKVTKSVPEKPKSLYTQSELETLVYAAADKYGANRATMLRTVTCEAKRRIVDGVVYYDASAQSDIITRSGVRENSWGLAQWNLTYNPSVSLAEATNAHASLDMMASAFAKGQQRKWSCYRKFFT